MSAVKLFIDVDCYKNRVKYESIDDIIYEVKELFDKILDKYGHKNKPMIVLNIDMEYKFNSYIIFPTVCFRSIDDLRYFIFNIKSDLITNEVIDTSIYTDECVVNNYCHKKGKHKTEY